jgi:hypothetical protein
LRARRCCIDPTDLKSLLPCLPIYLAGCDTLLALRGPTYLFRLWYDDTTRRAATPSRAPLPRCLSRSRTHAAHNAPAPTLPLFACACGAPDRRCVVELFVFCEMTSAREVDASRIQLVDFVGTSPYTADGTPSSVSRVSDGGVARAWRERPSHEIRAVAPTERFDVRRARCVMREDADSLLAGIESCGSGFDAFNAWMHALLVQSNEARIALLLASDASPTRKKRISILVESFSPNVRRFRRSDVVVPTGADADAL